MNTPATHPPLRILIVDDEPMLRSVIQDFLQMLGYEDQQVACDGREAVEMLRTYPIDCMISDIRMPEMELEDVLEIVRVEFPRLTVIATSGYNDFASAANIIMKGAHDFLGKPLNLDDLESALGWVLERRRIMQAAERAYTLGEDGEPCGDGPEENERLIEMMRASRCFPLLLGHAASVADLCRRLDPPDPAIDRCRLFVAAALHEMGVSSLIHNLIQQSRRLEDQEYHLILHAVRQQAGLVGEALQDPQLTAIIAEHLDWQTVLPSQEAEFAPPPLAALWLGLLNSLDGLLNDRSDRPGHTLAQVREWFERQQRVRPLRSLQHLLSQWPAVERYYAARSHSA